MLNFEYAARFELVVSSRSTVASTINIVGATREGLFKFSHLTVPGSTTLKERFNIPDLPIWVSVVDKIEDIKKGHVYTHVDLAINSDTIQALTAGYVYSKHSLTWPMSNIEPSDPTPGAVVATNATNPAAGAEWNITVPDGEMWRIMAIRFNLVTSATVANRRVHVSLEVGGAPAFELISSVDQAASLTRAYTCQAVGGAGTFSDDNDILIAMPDNMLIPGGDIIRTLTTNLQAGDDYGVATITYQRYITLVSPL